jgi:hypothetical protein
MTPEGCSHLFIAVLMGAASINAANAQVALAATQNPDGIYAVDITTQQGDCDKAYHWMISVSGGHVSAAGDTPMKASGQISPRGTVDLAFQRFGQVATVAGRFARGYGSGSGPRRPCDAPVRGGHSGKANY